MYHYVEKEQLKIFDFLCHSKSWIFTLSVLNIKICARAVFTIISTKIILKYNTTLKVIHLYIYTFG